MSTLVTKSPVTTEDFARYEFKYLLNARLREEIENDISHFMTYDGHVDENLGNQYFVRSLYYDTPTSRHYHEKIDGTRLRRKFEARILKLATNSNPQDFKQASNAGQVICGNPSFLLA